MPKPFPSSPSEESVLPCADKLAFDTPKQARAAAAVAEYQHGAQLKIYRCRHCNLWHLSTA
jgi:hypothetical protein